MSGDGEARRRAIEESGSSFVMEAAAGTGKTHTLVSRVLNLVLEKGPQGPPLRLSEICAITFTEKAADEMKARLRFELEKKLDGTDTSGASEIRERILKALDDLETAAVSTFHSFAAGLLKERPIEAGIDPRFSALDAIQSELFFREVWDAWIASALKRRDPALEKALRGGFHLKDLKNLAQDLREHWLAIRDLQCAAPDEEQIALEIRNRLNEGRDFMRLLLNADDKLAGYLFIALEWLENPDSSDVVLTRPGASGSKNGWTGGKDTVEGVRGFVKKVVDLQTDFMRIPIRRLLYETVQWLRADFTLGEWEKKKSASGFLDFDDQLYLACELLRRHDGVRAEFRERYKTLLVDEFQDTDPVQLEIVLLLTSKGGDLTAEPGRLFIVGDPKQSIYRFRGADIETYLGFAREEKLRDSGIELLTINKNFRSVPSILRFADEAFAEAIHPPGDGNYQSSYTAFNNDGARREEPGAPSVHILCDAADESAERKTKDLAGIEAGRIAKLIRAICEPVNSGLYRVYDAEGGWQKARYGDIAILLPTFSHSDEVEDALRENGVPYILEGGRFYYTRSEVGTAVTALSSIANAGDEVALCGALKSIFFGISDEDLLRARVDGIALDYRHPAPEDSPLHAPFEILRELHNGRHERPASETFEMLLRETGAREILASRGRQHLANLNKITRSLRAIEGRNGFSRTIELLSVMEKEALNESESRLVEARSDAVRVTTIHKSKGLDFPIVIAAALGLKKNPRKETLLADRHELKMFAVKSGDQKSGRWTEGWEKLEEGDRKREDAELVRLLYVALTRAKDHLILSAHTCKRAETEEGVFAPDVSGTRLEPLKAVLGKCLANKTIEPLARLIDEKQLDSCVIPAAEAGDKTVSGEGIAAVEREYRELRELIENTPETDIPRTGARTSCPQILDKCGQNARIPGNAGGFAKTAIDEYKKKQAAALSARRRRSVRIGTAFHEVMERVDLKYLAGLAELLREAGARNNLDRAGCLKLGDMVEKCLASDLMLRARDAAKAGRRILRETPFIRPLESGGVEEGRIDLLFEEGDAWTLVDYKTGRIPKNTQNIKDTDAMKAYFLDRYAAQAQTYRAALESLSIKSGGVFLLLARTGDIIEIP